MPRSWRMGAVRSLVAAALLAGATGADAQRPARGVLPVRAAADQDSGRRADNARRAELERRVLERINTIARQRLQLTDSQYVRLRIAASRIEGERRQLRAEEFTVRTGLRRALTGGEPADERIVGDLLDRVVRLERRRADLMEAEQRELAQFLTPSQRARYIALQDELRRSMQEFQRRRMGDERGGPPGTGLGPLPRRSPQPPPPPPPLP